MRDETLTLLRDLVAINSVNPSLVPGGAGELQIAEMIAHTMRTWGLDVSVTEIAPGRPNVVGVLEGRLPGRSLMFCGHIDTVGVAGMERPFEPVERDGRLYGRGSQDMKGGVAAMLGAASQIIRSGGLKQGKLIVAAVADEEHESLGAEALIREWGADAAVVTEPTDLMVAITHKGFTWVEVTAEGRAAHGSKPEDGRDAIFFMSRVMTRLERLDAQLQAKTPYSFQGTGSLHASLINGGRELSSYPDRCVLQVERRTISKDPPGAFLAEVQLILRELAAEDPNFRASCRLLFDRLPFETPKNHPLPELLHGLLGGAGQEVEYGGVSFWTDAAVLASASIPTVVFGPGGNGMHGLEEYVRLSEVTVCRNALAALANAFC